MASALYAGFALLFLAGVAAVVLSQQSDEAQRWVAHTLEVRRVNQALLGAVQNAALGERGYLITRDRRYLRQYQSARSDIPGLEAGLAELTRDNPAAQAKIDALRGAIQAQLAELDRIIGLLEAGHPEAVSAAVRSHLTANPMDAVRQRALAIDQGEARLLGEREQRASSNRALLAAAFVFCLMAALALVLFVVAAWRNNLRRLAERNAALVDEMAKREALEAQLRQAQKMEALGQLTGGIAHDFNNMLAIVIGNLDMLARRLESDEQGRRRFAERALEGANRAAQLTQSLLAFSRRQPLAPRTLDINRSIAELSRMLRSTLGEGVAIETVLAGGLWPAFIDPPQLEGAVLNLAINARDAMPGGGKLTIETANAFLDETYAAAEGIDAGQYVLVAVSDTGQGMSADVIEKAFEPFFTTKTTGQGTGLGLSQVHGFVKQSGGHVKLYSEPGAGTTVKLYLPRARQTLEVEAASPHETPLQLAAGAVVLVVEDEAGVRTFACAALADLGYETLEAEEGRAALDILRQRPDIDLMLTDVVMPGMNGRELARAALAERPDLKVLFMTGYTRNAIVHNGVLDADARLITKPFSLSLLAAKVREAMAA